MSNHSGVWLHLLVWMLAITQEAISIPFFGPFRQATTTVRTTTPIPVPHPYQQLRGQRIINADHGVFGAPPQSSAYAGGNIGYSPWISETKDQFIRNQLVILHPDSSLNREAWKESGYLNPDFDPTPRKANNASSIPKPTTARPQTSSAPRARKLHRKSKQQQHQNEPTYVPMQPTTGSEAVTGTSPDVGSASSTIADLNQEQSILSGGAGLYDYPQPVFFRDINGEVEEGSPMMGSGEPILLNGNNLLIPITAPYPYAYHQPRGGHHSQQQLPPEAMIQFLKSPEQELSPLTRPQVKLPFPLSRDCSASGGSRTKPLQFVVLPIVEPVAPLKPIFPKPSFLSQYGQFPYIPPFNLFKRPPLPQSQDSQGGGSGQFVPILNRPAPPLPFVFVQSLPLELIGQQDMDVIHSASPTTTFEKIKEIPIAAPQPTPTPTSPPQTTAAVPVQSTQHVENVPIPNATRPLPLIVIEKVKTPGQPPSSPLSPAATVIEISKQSIQKSGGSGSAPLSTISVVQPISAPGSKPPTLQQQQQIQKAIEQLMPVAAAVLENVELQQQKQKEQGRDRDISNNADKNAPAPPKHTISNEEKLQQVSNVGVPVPVPHNEQDKTPLRPPLRPATKEETVIGGIPPIDTKTHYKRPDISSSEEIGTGASTLTGVEVTEA